MSIHSRIADAVAAELAGAELSLTLPGIERRALPVVTMESLAPGLHVHVVPGPKLITLLTRRSKQRDYGVNVVLIQRIDPGDNDQFDPLDGLLDEVADHFLDKIRPDTYSDAACIRAETVPGAEAGYAPAFLDEDRCYFGVMRLTFRVIG